MCSPVSAGRIAHALKLPRVVVVRRLQEMVKHGYVERVGNAYRVTDKVNIPDLKTKLQRRMDMIVETARKLSELTGSADLVPVANEDGQASRTSAIQGVWGSSGPVRRPKPAGWPYIGVGYSMPCRSIMWPRNSEEA